MGNDAVFRNPTSSSSSSDAESIEEEIEERKDDSVLRMRRRRSSINSNPNLIRSDYSWSNCESDSDEDNLEEHPVPPV